MYLFTEFILHSIHTNEMRTDSRKSQICNFTGGARQKKYNYNVMKVSTLSIFLITML